MEADWARDIRDQCIEAGVPFHFKQWAEFSRSDMDESWTGKSGTSCQTLKNLPPRCNLLCDICG